MACIPLIHKLYIYTHLYMYTCVLYYDVVYNSTQVAIHVLVHACSIYLHACNIYNGGLLKILIMMHILYIHKPEEATIVQYHMG